MYSLTTHILKSLVRPVTHLQHNGFRAKLPISESTIRFGMIGSGSLISPCAMNPYDHMFVGWMDGWSVGWLIGLYLGQSIIISSKGGGGRLCFLEPIGALINQSDSLDKRHFF